MGRVYLVGAGPGRADLLTLRAASLLRRADVILYDRLVSAEVLQLANPAAALRSVGKEHGLQEEIQHEILNQLVDCAKCYETVVRLKGGDPMVFGRGAEEWAWLAERGVDVEIVPGVSSAISVPSLAGIPPTFRGVAGGFAVVTGQRRQGGCQEWQKWAHADTLIILMGVAERVEIAQCLLRNGRPATEPVAFIENGTTSRERIVVATLGDVAEGKVDAAAPAVFVVGEVVRLRDRLIELVRSAAA